MRRLTSHINTSQMFYLHSLPVFVKLDFFFHVILGKFN